MIRFCIHSVFSVGIAGLASAFDPSAYDIQPRQRQRQLQWADIEDEAKISFDGNVAAIQALALEKAAALSDIDTANDETPGVDLAVPVTCDGTLTQTVHNLRFDYTVEYDPAYDPTMDPQRMLQSTSLPQSIIPEIESELQRQLSKLLLFCETQDEEILEANVVGLVRTPKDEKLKGQSCFPTEADNHACADYRGKMTLFLADKQKREMAEYLALWNVKNLLESSTMIDSVGRGLVKITYKSPDPIAPYEPLGADGSNSSMKGAAIAVMSAGSVTVLVFLAIMFAWRRKLAKDDLDRVAYHGAGTHSEGSSQHDGMATESDEENGPSPSSPFSEMLPSAYRYSENMSILSGQEGLSAVTEVTESDGTQSINISLSGFSEEAAGDASEDLVEFPKAIYERSGSESPDVFGAHKRVYTDLYNQSDCDDVDSSVDDGSISDVSTSPKEAQLETSPLKPAAMTSLLLEIASPKKTNTSTEDDALLFLS